MSATNPTDAIFEAKYQQEQTALSRLSVLGRDKIGAGADDNLKLLAKINSNGLHSALDKCKRFPSRQQEILELVSEFVLFGAKAVLLTGAQRGGDFLNNQLRGQWAERVALSMDIEDVHLVPFGPSGAAMPGEQDHREVIMTFKEIHLLEGKRPDLLGYSKLVWENLAPAEQSLASSWPKRRLESVDDAIVRKALCGLEVKNSTWHYEHRRKAGGGPLSITVKKEEVAEIENWSRRVGLPVIFLQVLFDEIYCMSFCRMQAAIRRGFLYAAGDYLLDEQTGGKLYHKFHLTDQRHRCGKVVFPDQSTAEVRLLEDGSVVPFINFQPAQATDVDPKVLFTEIGHVEPPAKK